jgi:Uma2 family endonuclease
VTVESTSVPSLSVRSPGPHTWDDFVALDEDDLRELIDGHLIEIDGPTQLHELIVASLLLDIGLWARQHQAGRVMSSGYKIRINAQRGVMPDVQFYRPGNLPSDEQQGLVSGRPDLVVEVMSPSSRTFDSVTKLNWYAARGIPEYWVVNPDDRALLRYLLKDGRYFVEAHRDDDIFTPETLPGLRIPLGDLWSQGETAAPR